MFYGDANFGCFSKGLRYISGMTFIYGYRPEDKWQNCIGGKCWG